MPGGRPREYSQEYVERAKEYLSSRQDMVDENGKLRVSVPTKGGLAKYLGVSRETLYDWASKYEEFSDVMEQVGAEQEDRLINNGLAGTYNPTIAKVLLTKHGYREGIDQTTNDKDLPNPVSVAARAKKILGDE